MKTLSPRLGILSAVVSLGSWLLVVWLLGVLSLYVLTAALLLAALPWALTFALRRWTRWKPRPARTFTLWFTGLGALAALWPLTVLLVQMFLPFRMPVTTLTNGEKTVEFHGMMHIGSPAYYEDVMRDLADAERAGVPILHEGVRSGDQRSRERLKTLLGLSTDLDVAYKILGDLCGLQRQILEMEEAYRRVKDRAPGHELVDVTATDMMREWDRLVKLNPGWAAQERKQRKASELDEEADAEVLTILRDLPDEVRTVSRPVCLTLMRIASAVPAGTFASGTDSDPFLEHVVKDYRDRHLAGVIGRHDASRLVVVYGADHLDGTLAHLKKLDPAWRVERVRSRSALPSAGVW